MVLVLYDEPPYQPKCLQDTKHIKGQTNNSDIFQVSELASILCQLAIGLEFRIFCEGTLQYLITNSDKGMPASFARFPTCLLLGRRKVEVDVMGLIWHDLEDHQSE